MQRVFLYRNGVSCFLYFRQIAIKQQLLVPRF
jgi:hypothetical protein